VVRSQGRKRAFCGGSEEKSRLFFGRDFCLETQARRAFAVANEAERRVPRGADRLLSRWPEEHAGQKEIDLVCRVPGKTWQCIHLFCRRDSSQYVAEVNFAGYGEMLPPCTTLCCHPGRSRYIANLLPDADGPCQFSSICR
jgi:hypothetical protein